MIGLEYYTPTEEQLNKLGVYALASRVNKIFYKKIDTNYLIYHTHCGQSGNVDEKTLGQIKSSHICPFCFAEIDSTTDKAHKGNRFVAIDVNDDETYGYLASFNYELGKPIETNLEQVYYASGNECYHRKIGFDAFANHLSYQPSKSEWKLSKRRCSRNSYGYNYDSYKYENLFYYPMNYTFASLYTNKRDYLNNAGKAIVKSNQKKIAIDNLLNKTQIRFMVVFDLNKYEDIKKYNKYMCRYKTHIEDFVNHNFRLNVYYLDYLYRNKISLSDYFGYLNNLDELGFKYDKPTDFKFRKETIQKMVEDKRDKEINERIEKRYTSLPSYENKGYTIHPFKTADEIRRCGKALHCCIGTYVSKYSKGQTDIYHMDVNGNLKVAIEIKDKRLYQARTDHNRNCPADLYEHIKTFCNINGFTYDSKSHATAV